MSESETSNLATVAATVASFQTVKDVLENEPLHSAKPIRPDVTWSPNDIRVHCEKCGGVRRHKKQSEQQYGHPDEVTSFLLLGYQCVDCNKALKVFGLKFTQVPKRELICTKIYQEPPFGNPIPPRLFEVIGETNREHFLQARRAIARSLGIGAFAYYRRIVENTKFELVDSILKIAKATHAPIQQIELLERAKEERQFSKAIELLGDVSAIPAALLIEGQNPLALLHDLLSEGIHQFDDKECLERATHAEVIICEIAEKLQQALTEKKSVKSALASIMNRKQQGVGGQD